MTYSYTCPVCKKFFEAYQRRTTCSKQCFNFYQTKKQTIPCTFCGRGITDVASRFKRAKRAFCSTHCLHEWEKVGKIKFPQLKNKEWCQEQYKTMSLRKISEYLGCGETTVYKYFKQHQIKLDRCQWISGSKHYFWKNGITELARAIRTSQKYKVWRSKVLALNDLQCAICKATANLEVDHIKKFKFILIDNKVKNLKDAYSCFELWDVKNGRILCSFCNKKDCNINRVSSPNLQ